MDGSCIKATAQYHMAMSSMHTHTWHPNSPLFFTHCYFKDFSTLTAATHLW